MSHDTTFYTDEMQHGLAEVIQDAVDETVIAFFTHDVAIEIGPFVITVGDEPYQPPQTDVTAIVGFSGVVEGGVHLSAPLHAALGLAVAFSGDVLETFDATARDAIGELANIIAGAVKDRINDAVYLTPPQVVVGINHKIVYTKDLSSVKCYFKTANGPFFVEVFYRK